MAYTARTRIREVNEDPVFRGVGASIFPRDSWHVQGDTLGTLDLAWYSCIRPEMTVEICNYLHDEALLGRTIFYPIYSTEEMVEDPDKRGCGLFFRGKAGAPTAVCCAGGGFAYVAAIHDAMPHALTLSERGINAFALIYRPGAQTACEDLSRALAFLFGHAGGLGISVEGYSLWGGSAGARMAAWVGSLGTAAFGEKALPRPAAVIMQYTGYSEVRTTDPATYSCVGTQDGIANWRTMDRRMKALRKLGTPAEIEVFPGLHHGFGLGTGTVAEGWLDRACDFWLQQRGRL